MRVTRPGYWLQVDKKTKVGRIWSFTGERIVAVIDLLKREVVWSETEIEVQILGDDIHIKPRKRGRAFATFSFSSLEF